MMVLTKLFEMQAKLDAHINENHPPQPNEDRLGKKILALLVELGECANEWRGFKFWSKDQEPRTNVVDEKALLEMDNLPHLEIPRKNKLLEEYVDCLHFILSIGLDVDMSYLQIVHPVKEHSIQQQFQDLFLQTSMMFEDDYYIHVFRRFVGLGEMLGFTWEQIEQAYFDKNSTNHDRQNTGY